MNLAGKVFNHRQMHTKTNQQLLIDLNKLSGDPDFQSALDQAMYQQETITPYLLKIVVNYPTLYGVNSNYKVFLCALYLLAQFREKAAYPIIIKFANHYGLAIELLDSFAENVSVGLGRVLASVCGSDLLLIKQLIGNQKLSKSLRDAGLRSLVVLYNNDKLLREELVVYFTELIHHCLEEEDSLAFCGSLISYCNLIYPKEFYQLIVSCFDQNKVDLTKINLDIISAQMLKDKAGVLNKLKKNPDIQFINNADLELNSCGFLTQNNLHLH